MKILWRLVREQAADGFCYAADVMSSKWMCQQSLRCGSRRRVRTGIGAFKRGRQGAATRIGRARYWSSGPFQSVKSYTAHHRCSVSPARFAIEAPACHDRPPYLDSAVKRPAKQATKKDAHRSSIPGRSAPVRWANWVAIVKRAVCTLADSGPNICEFAPTRVLGRDARRGGPRVQ